MARNKWVVGLAAFAVLSGLLCLAPASAWATTTTVANIWPNQPGGSGEWNLFDNGSGNSGIMEYLYGAGNFTRIDDDDDKTWVETNGGITAIALFAGAHQQLGYRIGGTDTLLGSELTSGITPSSTTSIASGFQILPDGTTFVWLDDANNCCGVVRQYSDPAILNIDNDGDSILDDHMVTFSVTGSLTTPGDIKTFQTFADGHTRYIIAFEDLPFNISDLDYNDLVVELKGVAPSITVEENPVPEPATVLLLGSALAALGFTRRRKGE